MNWLRQVAADAVSPKTLRRSDLRRLPSSVSLGIRLDNALGHEDAGDDEQKSRDLRFSTSGAKGGERVGGDLALQARVQR